MNVYIAFSSPPNQGYTFSRSRPLRPSYPKTTVKTSNTPFSKAAVPGNNPTHADEHNEHGSRSAVLFTNGATALYSPVLNGKCVCAVAGTHPIALSWTDGVLRGVTLCGCGLRPFQLGGGLVFPPPVAPPQPSQQSAHAEAASAGPSAVDVFDSQPHIVSVWLDVLYSNILGGRAEVMFCGFEGLPCGCKGDLRAGGSCRCTLWKSSGRGSLRHADDNPQFVGFGFWHLVGPLARQNFCAEDCELL